MLMVVTMMLFALLTQKKLKMQDYVSTLLEKNLDLCKEHYKEWKKATKDDRSLERARYDRN